MGPWASDWRIQGPEGRDQDADAEGIGRSADDARGHTDKGQSEGANELGQKCFSIEHDRFLLFNFVEQFIITCGGKTHHRDHRAHGEK